MRAVMNEIAFETHRVNGIDVHIHPTDKFKTTTMVLTAEQSLAEETVTKTALLANVLKRGTARFPETRKLRAHLDSLYGAVFDVDVLKKGERQVMHLYLETANEKFLSGQTPLLEQAIQFIGDVIARPYLEHWAFSEKYLSAEKESLRKRLESIIDDKMTYANQRVTEEMCKGEPFRLLIYGRVTDLPQITAEGLYQYYQEWTAHCPMNLFVVGDVEPRQVLEHIRAYVTLQRSDSKPLPPTVPSPSVQQIREVVDRLDVSQAKLNIGCRTHVTYSDDDYPVLLICNGILGGFPHSKLFVNVREKASLAYYAVSRLESHKGILMMMSGIDVNNYEKAVAIMKEQLEMIQAGKVSEEELNLTKATVSNQFRELVDSARHMIDFTYNGLISGRPRRIEEILEQIQKVTLEDVKRVAGKIQIDTVYLLRDDKGGE